MKNALHGISLNKKLFNSKLIEYFALIVMLGYCFFTMCYQDILITAEHSITLIDAILKGHFFDFYDWAVQRSSFGSIGYAVYEILLYLVFAIWNLPAYIAITWFHVDVFSIGCLLWYKLLIILSMMACGMILKKIGKALEIEEEKCSWIAFFYYSSLMIVLTAVQISTYDVIYLVPVLLGVYFYLEGNHKGFLICFSIAIPMKLMPLFLVIPLILLKEKRILWIIHDFLVSTSVLIICKLMFRGSPAYQYLSHYDRESMNGLFNSTMTMLGYDASLFIIAFFVICCFAYLRNVDGEQRKQFTIYYLFASFSALFMFSRPQPYWVALLIPFLIILVFYRADSLMGFGIEQIITLSYIFMGTLYSRREFGGSKLFNYLLLQSKATEESSFADFLTEREFGIYMTPINACIMGGTIILLIITHPKNKENYHREAVNYRVLAWIRLAIIACVILAEIKIIF